MFRKLVVAAALAVGAMLASAPASALPIDRGVATEAAGSQATQVRWVCPPYRRCYWVAPRRYYKPYYAPRRYYRPYYAPRRYY
jgi:hypothetical protein